MGLMDFIKSQLIEIIEWTDDSRDTLSYRYPDDDREIKRGAQLIVRESQMVQFVYLGQFGDLFPPGKHELTTDNIPILTTLKGWKYGFVRVRAFGTFDFKIVTPSVFLKEVAGSDHHFRLDEFADTMRSRIVSLFTDALATAKVPVLDLATRYSELGEAL